MLASAFSDSCVSVRACCASVASFQLHLRGDTNRGDLPSAFGERVAGFSEPLPSGAPHSRRTTWSRRCRLPIAQSRAPRERPMLIEHRASPAPHR